MTLFFVFSLIYMGALLVIRPAPSSLKARRLSFYENFRLVRASMFSGVFILFVFLVTTDFTFVTVNDNLYTLLSLNNDSNNSRLWPIQSVTHSFIHGNLVHLLSNLVGLGIASAYERRVGAGRFFTVLLVGTLASIPSILFYSEPVTVCGISGGIFGLAAAYFTDEDELTIKEWIAAIMLFLVLACMFIIQSEFESHSTLAWGMRVDHIGHAMGALGAILYCRLRPRCLIKASTRQINKPT